MCHVTDPSLRPTASTHEAVDTVRMAGLGLEGGAHS